jgi:hypothetical protein
MRTTATKLNEFNMTRSRTATSCLFLALASMTVLTGTVLTGCADAGAEVEPDAGAAKIEAIAGTELSRVTLTNEAAKRIDLKMAKVKQASAGAEIPYGSVLYDPDGHTWTFVNIRGLTFERKAIVVEKIVGDVATISSGPAVGTSVVTLGASQLYGAEIGVGDE